MIINNYRWIALLGSLTFVACKGEKSPETPHLSINEVVSSNDGVNIDESGQTEDWIELTNPTATVIWLSEYAIADSAEQFHQLPEIALQPNESIVLWADDDLDEGPRHLPFKLGASGDHLYLREQASSKIVEDIAVPALETNISFARFPHGTGSFAKCRYTTPGKENGEQCAPSTSSLIEDDIQFTPFKPTDWPSFTPQSLAINELALFPAEFIELRNLSSNDIDTGHFRLVIAPHPPSAGLPPVNHESSITLPSVTLAQGQTMTVSISDVLTEAVSQQAFREGIAVLYNLDDQTVADRIPFMHWPEEAVLAREEAFPYTLQFCENASPSELGHCDELESRDIGNRLRGLYTPTDYAKLAEGGSVTNAQSIKFIIDLEKDNAVHFPAAKQWPLHYTFVREIIDLDPPLNRCESGENSEFIAGWVDFSTVNYSSPITRRYHLGTLTKHPNADLNNVEFTFGDSITAQQMRDAFYTVTRYMQTPYEWSLRPQNSEQVARARAIEGTLPIVSPKAPFKDLVYQGLTPGIAYGTLQYVPTDQLSQALLGEKVIVVTNDVPNDIDFVGGLITEAFQTPLAHVNILSQARGTPNMALPNASILPEIAAYFGQLVRLEVNAGGYALTEATLAEAEAFWDANSEATPELTPRLDTVTTQLIDLLDATINDIPTIGAKAAQLAELTRVNLDDTRCLESSAFNTPDDAFAIPMAHYLRHVVASGAQTQIEKLLDEDQFYTDSQYRKNALSGVRDSILNHPVDEVLLNEVTDWVANRFGNKRVRFRSSSNTEDLQAFNGAGLYQSISAELDDDDRPVDLAIKTVWSSLWNTRAVEERIHANVNQAYVGMGILVHQAFTNERANGVAVSRNILNPIRTDQYYFNSQAGEASVTNPAPGVITEELVYQWPNRTPTLTYFSNSSLLDGKPVLSFAETRKLACAMDSVHRHFNRLLNSDESDRWFTMESEFKFVGEERTFILKQARPYKVIAPDIPNDCREI